MTIQITREEQLALIGDLIRQIGELGYAKVAWEVTRGGTVRFEGERTAAAPSSAISEFRPKVGRR